MIEPVLDLLRCPHCGERFAVVGRSLRCRGDHAFDLAKQGYANLTDAAQPDHADSPAMVIARTELLASGRYRALTEALVQAVPATAGTFLDVGTGTGHYAAAVLATRPGARALGLDVSVAACRRAARAHPRLGVVTADAWAGLPVVSGAVDVVLSVFSPRHPEEFVRVLGPGGSVLTVTPAADHLKELRTPLGLIGVEEGKDRRLADSFARVGLVEIDRRTTQTRDLWTIDDAVRSVMMGPNAFHTDAARVREAADMLSWPQPVTVSCAITRWIRADEAGAAGCDVRQRAGRPGRPPSRS